MENTVNTAVGILPKSLVKKLVSWRVLNPNNIEMFQSFVDKTSGEHVTTAYSFLKMYDAADAELQNHAEMHLVRVEDLWNLIALGKTTLMPRRATSDPKNIVFSFSRPSINQVGVPNKKKSTFI